MYGANERTYVRLRPQMEYWAIEFDPFNEIKEETCSSTTTIF